MSVQPAELKKGQKNERNRFWCKKMQSNFFLNTARWTLILNTIRGPPADPKYCQKLEWSRHNSNFWEKLNFNRRKQFFCEKKCFIKKHMPEPLHHALVACVSRGFITIYTGKYLCIPIIMDAGTFRKLGAKCNVLGEQYLVYMPPEKLLGGGVLTPVPPFCLFCTIISNKTYILDLYQNTPRSKQLGQSKLTDSTPMLLQ